MHHIRTARAIVPREHQANWTERRQRRNVEMLAVARRKNASVAVQVLNLSYDGCCLEASARFEPRERFLLVVPRLGEVAGEVRWSHLGKVGVMFVAAA